MCFPLDGLPLFNGSWAGDSVTVGSFRCLGTGCTGIMAPETSHGVTVERCGTCHSLWFDASELDQYLSEAYAVESELPETRIPKRGLSGRRCPRCDKPLHTAGWTGCVLDRCAHCGGLFVEANELSQIQRELPAYTESFESALQSNMIAAGWALLHAKAIALLIIRLVR